MPKKNRLPIPACFTCTRDPRGEIPNSSMPQANEFDARNWSITQVKFWVRKVLPQYESLFEVECVSGMELLELTMTDLKEMGVKAIGHRKKFIRELDKLKIESGLSPRQEKGDDHTRNGTQNSPGMYPQSQRSGSLSFEHPPITPSASPGLHTPISSTGGHSPYLSSQRSGSGYHHPQGSSLFSSHQSRVSYGHHSQPSMSASIQSSRYHHEPSPSHASSFFNGSGHESRSTLRGNDAEYEAHRLLDHQIYQDFFGFLGPDPRTMELSFQMLWEALLASEVALTTCEQILQQCQVQENAGVSLDLFIRVMKCVYFAQRDVNPITLNMDTLHLTHTDTLPRFRPGFLDRYSAPAVAQRQHDLSFSLSEETRMRGTSDEAIIGRHPDKETIVNVSEVFTPMSVASSSSRGRENSSTNGVIETSARRRRDKADPRRPTRIARRPNALPKKPDARSDAGRGSPIRGRSVTDMSVSREQRYDTDVEVHDEQNGRTSMRGGDSVSPTSSREPLVRSNGELSIPPPPPTQPPPPHIEYDVDDGIPPPPPGPPQQPRHARPSQEGSALLQAGLQAREKICMKNLPERVVNDDDALVNLQDVFRGHELIEMDVYDSDYLVICRLSHSLTHREMILMRDMFIHFCRELRMSTTEIGQLVMTAGDITLFPQTSMDAASSRSSGRTPIRRQLEGERRNGEGNWNGSHQDSDSVIIREDSRDRLSPGPEQQEESDIGDADSPRRFSVSQTISEPKPPDYVDLYEELDRISYTCPPSSALRNFDIVSFLVECVSIDHNVDISDVDHRDMVDFLARAHSPLSKISARRLVSILRSIPEERTIPFDDVGIEFLCSSNVSDLISSFKNLEATHVRDLFGVELSPAAAPSSVQFGGDARQQGYVGIVIDGLPDDVTTDKALEDICSTCLDNLALNIEVRERSEVEDTRVPITYYESSSLLRITFRTVVSQYSLREMQLKLHDYLMDVYFRHSREPRAIDCVFVEAHTGETWQGVSLQPDQEIEDLGDVNLSEMIRMNSQHGPTSI